MSKFSLNKKATTSDTSELSTNSTTEPEWINYSCVSIIKIANFSELKDVSVVRHTITFNDMDNGVSKTSFRLMDILVYPTGISKAHENYVSVAADILEMNRYNLSFHCTISVVDAESQPRIPQSFSFGESKLLSADDKVEDIGLERYISRSKLFEEAHEFLREDTLQLQCELSYSIPAVFVEILKDQNTSEEFKKMIHFDFDPEEAVEYREYLHGRKTFESVDEICKVYIWAGEYEEEELLQKCSRFLATNLSLQNIAKIATLAYKFNDVWLKSIIADFFPPGKLIILESSIQRIHLLRIIKKLMPKDIIVNDDNTGNDNYANAMSYNEFFGDGEGKYPFNSSDAFAKSSIKEKHYNNDYGAANPDSSAVDKHEPNLEGSRHKPPDVSRSDQPLMETVQIYLKRRPVVILIESLIEACILYDIAKQYGRLYLKAECERIISRNLKFKSYRNWKKFIDLCHRLKLTLLVKGFIKENPNCVPNCGEVLNYIRRLELVRYGRYIAEDEEDVRMEAVDGAFMRVKNRNLKYFKTPFDFYF